MVFFPTRLGRNGFSLHCGARLKFGSIVIVTVCGSLWPTGFSARNVNVSVPLALGPAV